MLGTVKWFDSNKGYGFIRPDTGARDVFVHARAIERAELPTLAEGQSVEFQVIISRGRPAAAESS